MILQVKDDQPDLKVKLATPTPSQGDQPDLKVKLATPTKDS